MFVYVLIQFNTYYVNIIKTENVNFLSTNSVKWFFFYYYYRLYIEILDFISFMVAIIIKKSIEKETQFLLTKKKVVIAITLYVFKNTYIVYIKNTCFVIFTVGIL